MKRGQILHELQQKQRQIIKQQYGRDRIFGYRLVQQPSVVNIQQRRAMLPYIKRQVREIIGRLVVEVLNNDTPVALTGNAMALPHDPLTPSEQEVLRLVLEDIFQVEDWPHLQPNEDALVIVRGGIRLGAQCSKIGKVIYYLAPKNYQP